MTKQHSRTGVVNSNKPNEVTGSKPNEEQLNLAGNEKNVNTGAPENTDSQSPTSPVEEEEVKIAKVKPAIDIAAKLKAALANNSSKPQATEVTSNKPVHGKVVIKKVLSKEMEEKLQEKVSQLVKETMANAGITSEESEEDTDINITLFKGFKKPETLKQTWFATTAN
jgi:hypothetical protein